MAGEGMGMAWARHTMCESALIVTIRKILRLSRETSPQYLNKNHTKDNPSRKISPPYSIKRNPTTL
jgi:hypothetical protein